MHEALPSQARKTAAGMAALLAAGDSTEADLLLQLYLRQAAMEGITPVASLLVLTKTVVSMAVSVAGESAAEHFADLASKVQMVEP